MVLSFDRVSSSSKTLGVYSLFMHGIRMENKILDNEAYEAGEHYSRSAFNSDKSYSCNHVSCICSLPWFPKDLRSI